MAERLSTPLANYINATGSVKAGMANGAIFIYGGASAALPADADTAPHATNDILLLVITESSLAHSSGTNGINFDVSANGVLSKDTSETWSGDGLAAAGTGEIAKWFRFVDVNYDPTTENTIVRFDGSIGTTSTAELQMGNTTISEGGETIINTFTYATTRA